MVLHGCVLLASIYINPHGPIDRGGSAVIDPDAQGKGSYAC